jgi:hypothetical protein
MQFKNYLHKNNYQSPYYVTKWPQFDWVFPKIAGYIVGGNLEWVEYGYSTRVVKKIENHFRKK